MLLSKQAFLEEPRRRPSGYSCGSEALDPEGGQTGRQSLSKQCHELKISHYRESGSLWGRVGVVVEENEFVETGAKAGGQAVGVGGQVSAPLPLTDYIVFTALIWRCNLHL